MADEGGPLELSSRDRFGLLVGSSPPMRAAYAVLEQAASDATVLLEGETGTGKGDFADLDPG